MSASGALAPSPQYPQDQRVGSVRRMAVGWQNPATRAVSAVGLLEYDGVVHRFRYLRDISDVTGFRPFIGFPELNVKYESEELFPLFAQRAMSPRRPDYSRYLSSMDLEDGASTWEQLARTEGRLASDTIHLIPEPTVSSDGMTSGCFLVAGIRHRLPDEDLRNAILSKLCPGNLLQLKDEPANPVNPNAILTTTESDVEVGWVPNMLVDFIHDVRRAGPVDIRVRHVNGPDAPAHMRLLVEFRGYVQELQRPFDRPGWETFG